jgi:hypothetical protein
MLAKIVVMESDTTSSLKTVVWDGPDFTRNDAALKRTPYRLIAMYLGFAALFLLVPKVLMTFYPLDPEIDQLASDGRFLYALFVILTLLPVFIHVLRSVCRVDGFRANIEGMHFEHSHKPRLAFAFVNKKSFVRWSNVSSICFNKTTFLRGTYILITVALEEPLADGSARFWLRQRAENIQWEALKQLAASISGAAIKLSRPLRRIRHRRASRQFDA